MAEKKNSPASGRKSEVQDRDWLKRQVLKLTLRLTPALVVSLAMTVSLSANHCPLAQAQTAETASLRKISVDANRFIVFEYSSGGVKAAPQLFEMPSPDHRLIIDLPSTVVDSATMPSADDLSAEINRVFPGIRKVRFLTPVKETPTVRVAFDLAIPAKIKAALRILDGAVSLGLNDEYTQPVTAAAAAPEVAAAPAADAYSQYAKALVAQKPEQPDDQGEWGPRKGSADELKGVVKGFKPLVSAAALQTPSIQTDLNATLPVEKKPQAAEATASVSDTATGGGDAVSENTQANSQKSAVQLRDTTPDVQITSAAAPSSGANSIAEAAEAIEKEATVEPAPVQKAAQVEKAEQVQRTAPVARAAAAEQPENEVAMAQGETQAASSQNSGQEKTESPAAPDATSTAAAEQSAPTESNEGVNNPKIQARRFFNKAVKEHLSGQVPQAIADYKAALAIDPELGDAHSNLGLAYNQQHNYANALSEFRKALAINPSDAITYNGVGAALRAQKDVPGAIKNWETSVKLSPKLAVAHYNLGTAYESQGDLDRAMVSYENATRNDQRLGEAFYRMGLIMMKKHKAEEAKEQFKRALKISENSDYSADARLKLASIGKVK